MKRGVAWALLAMTLAGLLLRVWGVLGQPPFVDDVAVALSAGNWVQHGQAGPSMPFHPRLRDALVSVSLGLFGPSALGVKGWSLLFGALCVPLVGLLVWRLSKNATATLLAAGLVAVDIVQIGYSRQAIQETQTAFFVLLGTWLVVEAVVAGPSRRWRWLLPVAGLAYGLGVASKFYAIPPLLVSLAVLLWGSWKRRRWDEALFAVIALVGVSFLAYLLTWAPWFGRGYSIGDWVVYQRAMIESMVTHTRDYGFVKFDEPALWFIRPFTGYADFAVTPDGSGHLSVATGNPLVWLAVLPAVAYSLIVKRSRKSHQLLQAYFWAMYLPLAVTSRPIWVLSSVAVMPFAFAILALVAADVGRRFGRGIVYGYAAVALVTSLALYPLAIGRSLDFEYLQPIVRQMGDYASHMRGAQ